MNTERKSDKAIEPDQVGTSLTPRPQSQPVDVGLLRATNAADMIKAAEQIATPLAGMITARGLFVDLGGNRHVKVEGWTSMLAMLGITPVEKWCKRHECTLVHPGTEARVESCFFEVYVELRRVADGQVIGGASAECGGPDELEWHWRGKKCALVAPNARRSMAGTRATSKAARLSFSWIIELAGFKATPAEEMTVAFESEPQRQAAPRASQQAGTGRQAPVDGWIKMAAKFDSKAPCDLCGNIPQKGEQIAYQKGRAARHWTCHEVDQRADQQAHDQSDEGTPATAGPNQAGANDDETLPF